jgi:hypothetical protein
MLFLLRDNPTLYIFVLRGKQDAYQRQLFLHSEAAQRDFHNQKEILRDMSEQTEYEF